MAGVAGGILGLEHAGLKWILYEGYRADLGAGGRVDARERAMEVLGEGVTRGRVSVPRLVSLLMQ